MDNGISIGQPVKSKCTPNLRKHIQIIIHLLVTCLCGGQIYSIAIDYMSGEITSKVNLTTPNQITLPSVSLCFPFLDLINLTKASALDDKLDDLLLERPFYDDLGTHRDMFTSIYSILGNLTVNQLNNLLKDIDNLIPKIKLTPTFRRLGDTKSGYYLVKDNSTCEVTRYSRQPLFCLTINCYNSSGGPIKFSRHEIFQPPYDGQMMAIDLNNNISTITTSTTIMFSEFGKLIQGSGQTAYRIGFNGQPPGIYIVTFSKIVNILSQENYEVSCRNYSNYGYSSRFHFIDACLNNLTASSIGSVFYGTIQALNYSQANLRNGYYQYYGEYLTPNITERNRLRKYFKFCRQHCNHIADKPDCEEEIYSPQGYRTLTDEDQNGVYVILLRAPTAPFEINQYFPEYTLLDLIIYLASSLNFWFGLSLISLSEKFLNCYCGLFTRPTKSRSAKINIATKSNNNNSPIDQNLGYQSKVATNRRARVSRVKSINQQLPTVYW
ncbi:uncharacterized protein LOC128395947 [Panonychus citri]|uniref:uncharacterized protein LOC128395947 n=1 Tax=Panonychus citri TaxID=50023 RepID=UPI002308291C|nr:uncharacterized protein LOC128395947 [Panonychus citri]